MKKSLLSAFIAFSLFFPMIGAIAQQQIIIQKVDTTFEGVKNLKISGSFAQVSLAMSESNSLSLSGSLAANEKVAGFSLTYKLIAGTLEININYPGNNWVTHSGEIAIKVPKGASVDIENTSGYIKADAVVGIAVNALTTSGKIFITGCEGDYALRSTSGDITATKCIGNFTATTNTGKVIANDCSGELNLTNLSGETSVISYQGNIIAESTSGKLLLESIKGNITAKSASALIKVSKAVGNLTLKSFSGQINLFDTKGLILTDSGAGDQIGAQITLLGNSKFASTEGSIKMRITNTTPELSFKLLSQEGFIQARGQSKKKKLNYGKGAILVESTSTTGGQVFN